MMQRISVWLLGGAVLLGAAAATHKIQGGAKPTAEALEWQLPNEKWQQAFKDEVPIQFVTRGNVKEWDALKKFWTETTETAINPRTGEKVERKAIKIKVPLGLSQAPPVPTHTPMTLARWQLGKDLYFDGILCSDGTVSCASCHNPKQGWTDQSAVSTGIGAKKGGVSAPTVMNAAYNLLQFWDGRAATLEDQAQGPPQNPLEMFDGDGHAWHKLVARVRARGDYTVRFKLAFGTLPTRDAIARAIATYERTVLNGNSINDRAELAMRFRVAEDGGKMEVTPVDYETVLKDAFASKDTNALEALGLKDQASVAATAKQLSSGRVLYFGKARCSLCHVGDNLTDNQFHNLGVGVVDGKLPADALFRYGALPTGHKDPSLAGATKTPMLRGLLSTAPYMHNGSEKTLLDVVNFYDRGGNANRYLDTKMRDLDAERAYLLSKANGSEYKGPKVYIMGPDEVPVAPFQLRLTAAEKADLVLFLQGLQGDPIDAIVATPPSAK